MADPEEGTGPVETAAAAAVVAASTATVEARLPSGTSTHIVITGTATLSGGTVVVTGTGAGGTTFTILTATGGRTGTFSGVTDTIPFTMAQLVYDLNNVFVVLVPGSSVAGSFNQASVATALGSTGGAGAFAPVFAQFAGLSAAQTRFTLDQLSGEVYASALSAGIENQALWLRTLAQHVRLANQCLCPETGAGGASGCNGDGTWRSWATPFGMAGTNQGDGNAHAFAYQSVGLAAGSDRRVGADGNGLVGFATGYSNWGNTTNFLNSSVFSNSFNLASYARAQFGQAWVLGIASYEYDGYNSRRPMDLLGAVANANFSGNQLGSYVESGYAIDLGGLQVQPLGALQYVSAWRNGANETGAGVLDLNVAGARADSFRSQLGSRFLYPITTGGGRCILPEAGAYWIHEYAADTRNDVNQFAGGGPQFLAYGANLGRDFGLFSLGVSTQAGPALRIGLNYQSYVTPTAVAHGGMGQVQLAW
jgi:outer membrane autotransporter protein